MIALLAYDEDARQHARQALAALSDAIECLDALAARVAVIGTTKDAVYSVPFDLNEARAARRLREKLAKRCGVDIHGYPP